MTWDNHGVVVSDPGQVVIESDPYRRLSYTWHSFTPELAERFGWNAEFLARIAAEPRSDGDLRDRAAATPSSS